MSRAFVSENDGWKHCIEKNRACMFAQGDGTCLLSKCKMEKQAPKKQQ